MNIDILLDNNNENNSKHPKCLGYYDEFTGDYDCGYESTIICEDCKYGAGSKNPEAKCNKS